MAYCEKLGSRIRNILSDRSDVFERKMFGGLAFLVSGNMCCGVVDDTLMARVGADNYENALKVKYVDKMDFTGKPMKGFVYVRPKGISTKKQLKKWVDLCLGFVETLSEKH